MILIRLNDRFQILFYPRESILSEHDNDSFYELLKDACVRIVGQIGDRRSYDTVYRLCSEGNYSSCIILSFRIMESLLRKQYEKTDKRIPLVSLMKRYLIC